MVLADWFMHLMLTTCAQVIVGLVVLVSALMAANLISKVTFQTVESVLGYRRSIYITGWIGTPVHELSHLLVFWIFRIKVIEIKLFTPSSENAELGRVTYELDSKNPLHRMATSLSGIAPLALGTSLIVALGVFLVPGVSLSFSHLVSASPLVETLGAPYYFSVVLGSILGSISSFLDPDNLGRWQFWLFMYVSTCVVCHFVPSRADLDGVAPGIMVGSFFLLLVNAVAISLSTEPALFALFWGKALGLVLSFLGIALGFSLMLGATVGAISLSRCILRPRPT